MAKHLLSFIKGEIKELDDKEHILLTKFENKYPGQNGGLMDQHVVDWIHLMNPDLHVDYHKRNSRMMNLGKDLEGLKLISIRGFHLYAAYNHGNGYEIYDTAGWQNTQNNCTLYAAIVCVIRPLVSSISEMYEILTMIHDKQGSESAMKLAAISKYYFDRGIEWFKYNTPTPKQITAKGSGYNTIIRDDWAYANKCGYYNAPSRGVLEINIRANNRLCKVLLIGEKHDYYSQGVLNFEKIEKSGIKTICIFEDDNNDLCPNVTFKEPYCWHYRDPYFAYYYTEHVHKGYFVPKFDSALLPKDPKPYAENIEFFPSDCRNMYCFHPIFYPYIRLAWFNMSRMNELEKYKIPEQHHPTLKDVKESEFYNPKEDDEYYKDLIERYSYSSHKEFIDKIENNMYNMRKIDFFKDLTFNVNYPINDKVAKWFESKCNFYHGIYNAPNDIFVLNRLSNALDNEDVKLITIYGGGSHVEDFERYINNSYNRIYNYDCNGKNYDRNVTTFKEYCANINLSARISSQYHSKNKDAKYLFVYIHGRVPEGKIYAKNFDNAIWKTKYNINSYGIYYRECGLDTDTYDLEKELKNFEKCMHEEFQDEIDNKNIKIVLLGHSYGACFAKYFLEHSSINIYRAISLDGSNLYDSITYYIRRNHELWNVDDVESDIIFSKDSCTYKGKEVIDVEKDITREYYDVMWKCKHDNKDYYLVNYYANEEDPNTPKIEKGINKHYTNYYNLRYGKEYYHSLHYIPQCLESILCGVGL